MFFKHIKIIKIEKMHIDHDHLKSSCSFSNVPVTFKNIMIKNTCLITIPNQSNIIQLELEGSVAVRDFRMHKGRTEINVPY